MEARLVKLLQSTIQDLDDVWREIGFSPKERAEQTELLFVDVTQLFKTKIEQEKVLLDTYQDNVDEMQRKIAECSDRLDQPSCAAASTDTTPSLVLKLSKLQQEFNSLDKRRAEMESKIAGKLAELSAYASEMKEPVSIVLAELKLTQDNYDRVAHQCQLAKHERGKRSEILASGREQIFDLLDCLQCADAGRFPIDAAVLDHAELDLSRDTVLAVQQRAEQLAQLKQEQSQVFLALFTDIRPLWEKLGVTPMEQDAFFARQGNSLGERAMQACRVELARLRSVFKGRLATFITDARADLQAKMDELGPLVGAEASNRITRLLQEETAKSTSESEGDDDDDALQQLLHRHEQELNTLDAQLGELKPIQQGVVRYLALYEERDRYERVIQDSSRLLSRNKRQSDMPTLQEEERMRVRVAQIPKLVLQLKQMISEVESKAGCKLTIGCKALMMSGDGENSRVSISSGTTAEALDFKENEHDDRVARERQQRKQQTTTTTATGKTSDAAGVRRTTGPLKPKN